MRTEIHGYPIEFDFRRLACCSDLIYYDGPLLSHFMDEYGDSYLMYWLEADDKYNRWMLIRTTIAQIQDYIAKKITLRDVILHPCDSFVWVTDVDDNLDYHDTQCVPLKNIPDAYLPDEDSLYEFTIQNQTNLSTIYNSQNMFIILKQIVGEEIARSNSHHSIPQSTATSRQPMRP